MARDIPQYISQLSIGSMPKVQYSMAGAEATQKVSAQLGAIAQDMHSKDMEIAALRADTEMKTTAARQYEDFGHDPGQLKTAQDSFGRKFVAGLPSELQDKATAAWSNYTLPYATKSTETYRDNQDKAHKLSILEGVPATIESGKTAIDATNSDVPEYQDNGYRALGANAAILDRMKEAKNHDGSMMFTPAEIVGTEHQIHKAIAGQMEANRKAPIDKAMLENPDNFILNPDKFSYKSEAEKQKYIKDAMAIREQRQKISDVRQVIVGEKANMDLVAAVDRGDPEALIKIEDARNEGVNPVFLDSLADRFKKINPVSQEKKDELFSNIADRVAALQISTTKEGDTTIGNQDATLEELIRLKRDITTASAQGVTNIHRYQQVLGRAIMEKAKNETGLDDPGLNWFGVGDPTEEYDQGYEVIQKYLERQGKENDAPLKSRMLQGYIRKIDAIPDEIKADPELYKIRVATTAAEAVAKEVVKNKMQNFPIPAVQRLLANPTEAPQFDEIFGMGSAAKVLGGK